VKLKKMLAAAGISTLAAATLLAGPAFAAGGIDGTGSVSCSTIKGTVSFKPPILLSTPQTVTSKIKTTASNCTASGGNVTSLKKISTSSLTTTANDTCANLANPSSSNITSKYSAKPKLNPSGATITATPSGSGFTIAGTVTSGSFNGEAITGSVTIAQSQADIIAACQGKGLKKLTITSGNTAIN
jgi:hypothetical protein